MGRSRARAIRQPDDLTCGPSSLKMALQILGIRRSLDMLIELCRTNRNGTNTVNMIRAINKLGLSVLAVQNSTLHHLQSALRSPTNQARAVLVTYLYDLDEKEDPHPDSGHWAVVSSYLASKSRIVLLDSASGKKKSYDWQDFRNRWVDYDLKRYKSHGNGKQFRFVRCWQPQLLLVVAKDPRHLPKFKIPTSRIFPAAIN